MGPSRKSPSQLTPLELRIMQVLWENGASTVQAVQEKLPGESLAYTTVQTMLNVLQRKGRVKRRLVGKAYEYRAVLSSFSTNALSRAAAASHCASASPKSKRT